VDQELNSYASLLAAARSARQNAYAPYSKFGVGAAIATVSGETFTGCNIENLSFGLTMCAERAAVASAVASGHKDLAAIAIVADSRQPPVPCGACRQVLAEFNPNLIIIAATTEGLVQRFELSKLLPAAKQGVLEEARGV
jgi:cytidine deaminase